LHVIAGSTPKKKKKEATTMCPGSVNKMDSGLDTSTLTDLYVYIYSI